MQRLLAELLLPSSMLKALIHDPDNEAIRLLFGHVVAVVLVLTFQVRFIGKSLTW